MRPHAVLTGLAQPYPFPENIQFVLHLTFPVLRILILVPLLFALINPVVKYTTVTSGEVVENAPISTSLLSPIEGINTSTGLAVDTADGSKYGNLPSTASPATSRQTTRPPSPDRGGTKVQVLLTPASYMQGAHFSSAVIARQGG